MIRWEVVVAVAVAAEIHMQAKVLEVLDMAILGQHHRDDPVLGLIHRGRVEIHMLEEVEVVDMSKHHHDQAAVYLRVQELDVKVLGCRTDRDHKDNDYTHSIFLNPHLFCPA